MSASAGHDRHLCVCGHSPNGWTPWIASFRFILALDTWLVELRAEARRVYRRSTCPGEICALPARRDYGGVTLLAADGRLGVSEYQYYEFAAVDRPLDGGVRRSVGQLVAGAAVRRAGREQVEQQRRGRRAQERRLRAVKVGRERLASPAVEGEGAWARVIAEKRSAGYDAAVELPVDLGAVTVEAEFARRAESLRTENRRRPGLIGRLDAAGL